MSSLICDVFVGLARCGRTLGGGCLGFGAGAVPSLLLVSHISVWAMLEVWRLLDGVGWLLLVLVTNPMV